jgi:adenine-specific DNA-methyltransferase
VWGSDMRRAEFALSRTTAAVKRHGKHYTPALLAAFLAERVVSQLRIQRARNAQSGGLRILDPACGDGELLFAVHRVAEQLLPGVNVLLVGYDLDTDAIRLASERAAELGIKVDWHEGDFLRAARELPRGSFDAVITNPPYVRTQQLGQVTAQTLAAEFGLTGRIDLTHPFVVLLPSVLRHDGVVGLLCSNRFLTTKAGANVRSVFQTSLDPIELYDLGDTKLFTAAVLPAIVIALNRKAQESTYCSFTSAYEDETATAAGDVPLFEALVAGRDDVVLHEGRTIGVRAGSLTRASSTSEPWRLAHTSGDEWLRAVDAATWRTFGEVAKIRVGIKSTADRVFISDRWESVVPKPEDELLLPLIAHDNLTPWRVSDHLATRVLYPYDLSKERRTLVNMAQFPSAMAYFNAHVDRLKSRRYVIEGGREWFEIWVPQKPSTWAIPKIVFPDISVQARFALDRSGAVVNGDCYWISLADIGSEDVAYLMLAVANSRFGLRFYDEVCGNKLYSGRRRWMTQYVARLPLPDPETDLSKELIRVTREMLGSGDASDASQLELIDKLVQAAFSEPIADRADLPATLF